MPGSNINVFYADYMQEGDELADIVLFSVDKHHQIHNNHIKRFDQHYTLLSPMTTRGLYRTNVKCCLLKSLNENTHNTCKIGIYGLTDHDGLFSYSQLAQIYSILRGKQTNPLVHQMLKHLTTAEYPIERETTVFYPHISPPQQSVIVEANWFTILGSWVGDVIFLN